MLRRHDLLRIGVADWAPMLALRPDLSAEPLVKDWARRGWPAIVRRFLDHEDTTIIPLAIPLPLSHGKRRLAFDIGCDTDVTHLAPVDLRDATDDAPVQWRPTIETLCDTADATGCALRFFGALLWQHVTGLQYLSAGSDLDLLWELATPAIPSQLLSVLADIDRAAPMRLDGELVFPDGAAANWRELWTAREQDQATVLVKTIDGVEMWPIAQFFTETAACS